MARNTGRTFFNAPGPTNIPYQILRAMDRPSVDFMGEEFLQVQRDCLVGLKKVFKTEKTVIAVAASGHASWEAAMTNTLSPGDTVLVPESGYFSQKWSAMCEAFNLKVQAIPSEWSDPIDPAKVEAALKADVNGEIKAVAIVHNETSTGTCTDLAGIRGAMDAAGHDALLLVDTISSLGSMDFRFDEWGIDVAVGGSQKGLMLPVGLGFNAISDKAMEAAKTAKLPRKYFDFHELAPENGQMKFPGTAPFHMFFGLHEALGLIEQEGLEEVFKRHEKLASATRAAVEVWGSGNGPTLFCSDAARRSNSITSLAMPDGFDANELREACADNSNTVLGGGLGKLDGRVFRIGHLGDMNEPMMIGALSAVEINMARLGIPHGKGGVSAAIDYLASA